MHLTQSSPKWFPYFGNQRRFVPFVQELLVGLGAKEGDVFFETNAGSNAIGYHMAKNLGLDVRANDLGYFSHNIAKVLSLNTEAEEYARALDVVALGSRLTENGNYQPTAKDLEKFGTAAHTGAWRDFAMNQDRLKSFTPLRGNLFDRLPFESGKFIYCDFAWPWKDGSATYEYTVTSDTLGTLLGDSTPAKFHVASGRVILQHVIDFLDIARQNFEYVILSNQSSNYPTAEVLEAHMKACGHVPVISRRQTVPEEYVDDLGKDEFFTEYQYVFTN